MKNKKDKRKYSKIIIVFITIIIFSLFFFNLNTNHTCIGEKCSVCISIEKAEELIKNFSSAILKRYNTLTFSLALFIKLAIYFNDYYKRLLPTDLKIRMNN